MMTAQPMVARGAHYKALLDTLDQEGAAKLHLTERERLLEAADALLFGEPDSEPIVRSAEVLIETLETSGRWSVEGCNRLREHLHGCGAPAGESWSRALTPAGVDGRDLRQRGDRNAPLPRGDSRDVYREYLAECASQGGVTGARRIESHGRPTSADRGHDLDRLAVGGPFGSFAEKHAAARGIRQAVRRDPAERGEPDGQQRQSDQRGWEAFGRGELTGRTEAPRHRIAAGRALCCSAAHGYKPAKRIPQSGGVRFDG